MDTTQPDTGYFTMDDLTKVLGTSKHTLYKWAARGAPDFPRSVRLPNGQIRVRPGDLDEWMRRRAS